MCADVCLRPVFCLCSRPSASSTDSYDPPLPRSGLPCLLLVGLGSEERWQEAGRGKRGVGGFAPQILTLTPSPPILCSVASG